MKLNLEYYDSNKVEIVEDEYKVIENFVNKYNEVEYEEKIVEFDSKKLQLFSTMGSNILNWYSFKDKSTILELGGNLGEITGVLCNKAEKVISVEENFIKAAIVSKRHEDKDNLEIIVSQFNDIDFKGIKFDYITLIGSLPYLAKSNGMSSKEFLGKLDNLLKPNGKLLIAVDNRFGLKYFSGNPDEFSNKKFVTLLNYNNEEEKIETYTKSKLVDILDANNYKDKKFYYPLPDYRIPNVIFSDLELPKYNNIDKYIPNYKDNSTILVDEIDLYREILKENDELFTFFANSFLVEASKNEFKQEYKYVSYNNPRKVKYRLITKIGDEYVDKSCVDENSKAHYQNIKENMALINEANIKTVDEILENGTIRSKYIAHEKLLSVVLNKTLEANNLDEFYRIIDEFYELIKKSSNKVDGQNTIFDEFNITLSEENRNELYFLENALWDMTFKNCFYIDGEFYLFDQEWKSNNMPAEYVLYRSLMYTISLRRFININDVLEKYDLTKYIDLFKDLDEKLQEEIREDKFWKYFNKNRYFDIDGTRQELINEQIRGMSKDKAIENLQKKVNDLENEKIFKTLKRKVGRVIRRKNNE